MSKEYDDYMAAKMSYDHAVADVEARVERLGAFASPLISNWKECYIDIDGLANPMGAVSTLKRVIGNNIPTPADIHQALVRYRETQKAGHAAWTALSEHEKKELHSPPWLKRR